MANIIPFSHFVNVTSTGLSSTFTFSRLNALVMSTPSIPQSDITTLQSLSAVATTYGTASAEYKYAKAFFSYVSKGATTPEKISFYNWQPTGQAPAIKGGKVTLAQLKQDGNITIAVDGEDRLINLSLAECRDISTVIEVMNLVLRDNGMSVAFNTITGGLIVTGNTIGSEHSLSFATGSLANALGLDEESASLIRGKDAEPLDVALDNIEQINGDYVSISYIGNEVLDFKVVSEWTNAQSGRYCFVANASNPQLKTQSIVYSELHGNDGFILNYGLDSNINALTQAAIASVDFSNINGALNFNFIEATGYGDVVGSADELEALNAQRANCVYNMGGYGQSQVLYGEGNIFGDIFSDITGFLGNTWLKAQLEIAGCNLFVSSPLVPLRGASNAILLAALQSPIDQAKAGGIIASVGLGGLTANEKANVITATGTADAIEAIESNGYYLAPLPLTEDDIKHKRRRVLLLYTRNIPTNRVVIQNYVIGA